MSKFNIKRVEVKYAIAEVDGDIDAAYHVASSRSGTLALPYIFNTEQEVTSYIEGMLTTFSNAMESLKTKYGTYDYETQIRNISGDIFYMTKGYFNGDCTGRVKTYYPITLFLTEYKKHEQNRKIKRVV